MQTYKEYKPTEFDRAGAFLPDQADWLVVPVGRNRDTGAFSESNFEVALEMLGGESETVEVRRFGHWACGWFEILIMAPGGEAEKVAREIVEKLENYPILDEMDYSNREYEQAWETWEACGHWEFIRLLDLGDDGDDLTAEDTWELFSEESEWQSSLYETDCGENTYFPYLKDIARELIG